MRTVYGLLALAVLAAPPALAQSERLAWGCTNAAAQGGDTGTNACPVSAQRWDYANVLALVAACPAGNCPGWDDGTWLPFAQLTGAARVFGCNESRPPQPWASGCSAEQWYTLAQIAVSTPIPPPAASTLDMATTKGQVEPGESFTLSWTGTGVHTCTASWTPTVAVPGSATLTQIEATDYAIQCQRTPPATGYQGAGYRIEMTPPPPPVPTGNVTVTPAIIAAGESSQLQWFAQNADHCDSSWAGPNTPLTGSMAVTPAVNTRYLLACHGLSGAESGSNFWADLAVGVTPIPPEEWVYQPARCFPLGSETITLAMLAVPGVAERLAATLGIHRARSPGGNPQAFLWFCDSPTGYVAVWRAVRGDFSCLRNADFNRDLSTPLLAAIDEVCTKEPTLDERTLAEALRVKWTARFEVDRGTTTTPVNTRTVYAILANGQRGAQLRLDAAGAPVLTGGQAQTIATGAAADPDVPVSCDGFIRAVQPGSATRYHSVIGRTSAQGRVLPASVAQCKLVPAPSTGWP